MRRRTPTAMSAGDLPAVVAAGPAGPSRDAIDDWHLAGRVWSRAHLGSPNGWYRLLPVEVRRGPWSVPARLKVLELGGGRRGAK